MSLSLPSVKSCERSSSRPQTVLPASKVQGLASSANPSAWRQAIFPSWCGWFPSARNDYSWLFCDFIIIWSFCGTTTQEQGCLLQHGRFRREGQPGGSQWQPICRVHCEAAILAGDSQSWGVLLCAELLFFVSGHARAWSFRLKGAVGLLSIW